jgi:3-oxoacyl-[acyl-carrier protein] reductase
VSAASARSLARRGAIAFIGSEVGRWGNTGLAAYAASKAGLVGFAQSLAQEAGARGVRVNVVSPGLIDTDMVADLPAERRAAILAHTALGRLGTPEDVAAVVAFALGPDAAFVSGAVLPVNGGLRVL